MKAVSADLSALAGRRRQAFGGVMGAFLLLSVLVVHARPEMLWAAVALYASAGLALAAGLGVPLVSSTTSRLFGALALVSAVLSVVVTSVPTAEGEGVGFTCFAKGSLAGLLMAGALTMVLAPLWRRAVDVRWAVAAFAGAGSLAVLAWVCPHHHALHLWASHLPIIPAVYGGARLVFGAALPQH